MVAIVQVPAAVPSPADTDAVAPRSYLAEVRTRFFHNRAQLVERFKYSVHGNTLQA